MGELAELFATAMDHAKVYPDLVKQRQLFGQRDQVFVLFSDLTRELDYKSLPLKALNVGQFMQQSIW
jgi:hypothetical protein